MSYALCVDLDRCFGCFSCEVACKQEHHLPVGPRWVRVVQEGPRELPGGGLYLDFYPIMCRHCVEPKCAEVCPQKAIIKRSDGIVLVQSDLCNGCRMCVEGCPFGLMDYDEGAQKASKCNLCVERLMLGAHPSCVVSCPGRALLFGKKTKAPLRVKQIV